MVSPDKNHCVGRVAGDLILHQTPPNIVWSVVRAQPHFRLSAKYLREIIIQPLLHQKHPLLWSLVECLLELLCPLKIKNIRK